MIKENFINNSLKPKNFELSYWANYLLNIIEEHKIVREKLTEKELIAFNLKEIASQKVMSLFAKVFDEIGDSFKNSFDGFDIISTNSNRLYDRWSRFGYEINRGEVGCFWGIRFSIASGSNFPELYAMIETPPDKINIRKEIVEIAKEINSIENYSINENGNDWQVIEISKEFNEDFVKSDFDSQLDYLKEWFTKIKEDFEVIVKKVKIFA